VFTTLQGVTNLELLDLEEDEDQDVISGAGSQTMEP